MPVKDLNTLRIFRDVAKVGGFTAAHRETGQSRATLSRHVAALEEELGTRLIERSTRSFRLTDQGQLLYDRAVEIFGQLDEAVAVIEDRQQHPQGLVRVAIPPSILQLGIGQEILKYLKAEKDVRVQVEASNRIVDIRHEGVDFIIRSRGVLDYPLDFVPVPLAKMKLTIVAHPSLQTKLMPTLQETLTRCDAIAWTGISGESHWQLMDDKDRTQDLYFTPRLVVDDIAMLRDAALSGLGIVMLPWLFVEEDIAQGRLIEVHTDLKPPTGIIHALHLGQHGMRPSVRHLLDGLKRATQHLR